MAQVVQLIGGFFSWVGGAFAGGGTAAGVGAGATTYGGVSVTTMAAVYGGATGASAATISGLATSAFVSQAASAAFQLALSTALSVAFQPQMASTGGAPLNWKADPQAPVPYVIGRTATGGSTVFKEVYGGSTARHLRAISVLSVGPIEGIDEFRANNVVTTFDSLRRALGYYRGFMWRDYKFGSPTEVAHVNQTPPYTLTEGTTWTSAHKIPGMATVQWVMRSSTVRYSTGPAVPMDVVLGPAAYDPRADSTVAGGSGTQRANDRTTWTFAGRDNPFLQGLSWSLGIKDAGVVIMGAGVPVAGIEVAAFVEGANIAEANGWTCGGVAYSSDAKYTVLEQLLRAGGGKPMRLGGRLSCVVSTPRVSIATLTGADLVGPIDLASPPGRRERFNTAIPRYREEDRDWSYIQADPVTVAAAVTQDGGQPRSKEIDYVFVQDKDQAAQLAAYDILDSRESGPWELTIRARWRALKPGDCITLHEPELGIDHVKLLIRERTRNPMTGARVIRCWTETDSKHAIALGATGSIPTAASYDDNTSDIDPPADGSFVITGNSVVAGDQSVPALIIEGASDSAEAADLMIRYTPDGGAASYHPAVPLGEGAVRVEVTGITGGTDYTVEVGYRSVQGVVSSVFTMLDPVTTGDNAQGAGGGGGGAVTKDGSMVGASSSGTSHVDILSITMNNVPASPILNFEVNYDAFGGYLTSGGFFNGLCEWIEVDGAGYSVMATGVWGFATGSDAGGSLDLYRGSGTKSGTVTYALRVWRASGSNNFGGINVFGSATATASG